MLINSTSSSIFTALPISSSLGNLNTKSTRLANAIDFDSYTYLDLTANYYGLDSTKITFGVANVLDKEPGYTSDAGTAPGNGNTFPAYFDAFGRYIFLNLTYGVQ